MEKLDSEKTNIIFLDYDGVVNTLMFGKKREEPYFNFPNDNSVNNYQAVKWLEKLCLEFKAKIVVTSTWRLDINYKECLYNGGLSPNIEIIGKTDNEGCRRINQIQRWIDNNKNIIKNYVIFDDEQIDVKNKHFIKTDTYIGITIYEYTKAKEIFNKVVLQNE